MPRIQELGIQILAVEDEDAQQCEGVFWEEGLLATNAGRFAT
jgi:hypothetical protein